MEGASGRYAAAKLPLALLPPGHHSTSFPGRRRGRCFPFLSYRTESPPSWEYKPPPLGFQFMAQISSLPFCGMAADNVSKDDAYPPNRWMFHGVPMMTPRRCFFGYGAETKSSCFHRRTETRFPQSKDSDALQYQLPSPSGSARPWLSISLSVAWRLCHRATTSKESSRGRRLPIVETPMPDSAHVGYGRWAHKHGPPDRKFLCPRHATPVGDMNVRRI